MAGEYANNSGQRFETIGDVLQGAGSFRDGLERMAELLRETGDELATESARRDDAASDFVNTLESFVAALSAAANGLTALETRSSPPVMTGLSSGEAPLLDQVSSLMPGALQAFEQRLNRVAQFLDDAVTLEHNPESQVPSTGSFGRFGSGMSSPDEDGGRGVIRVDELNQAIEQFISTLGRIEQIMEKATDIRVTVEAGDGWD